MNKQEAQSRWDAAIKMVDKEARHAVYKLFLEMKDALPEPATGDPTEAEQVCGEAYEVVGVLLSDLGRLDTPEAAKILDNLSAARLVHKDVLPWMSHEHPATGERAEVIAALEREAYQMRLTAQTVLLRKAAEMLRAGAVSVDSATVALHVVRHMQGYYEHDGCHCNDPAYVAAALAEIEGALKP